MQIKRFFVVASLVVTVGALVGCSESNSRRTARNLNDATQKANRLTQRSQALMANPTFLSGGQYSPLAQPLVSSKAIETMLREKRSPADREVIALAETVREKLTFVPVEQIHPEVLTSLTQARDLLQQAINEAGPAEGAEEAKAIAQAKLASIQNDIGLVHRREFDVARSQLAVQVAVVEYCARQAQREKLLVATFDALVTPKLDPSVVTYEQALREAKVAMDAAQADVDRLAANIKSLNEARAALQSQITTLSQDASDRLLDSQAIALEDYDQSEALFDESVALDNQAVAKTREMNDKDIELADAQFDLAVAQAKLAVFAGGVVAVAADDDEDDDTPKAATTVAFAGRVKDAEAADKNFKDMQARAKAIREEAQKRMDDYERLYKAAGAAVGEQYRKAWVLADDRAVKQFEQAMQAARAAYTLRPDAAVKALEGAAAREYATVRAQQGDMLATVLQTDANVPAAGIKGALDAADGPARQKDMITSAVEKLDESTRAFTAAADALTRENRAHQAWAFQANGAMSQLQLALLTNDINKKENAESLIQRAISGREKSPYLEYVRQLKAEADRFQGTARGGDLSGN
ncbi:MAG: hypothetical protein FWE88_04770 [Phycisphaerae bacterium]|nr:hypothetical protein [Phycisphaerae bacterium]